MRGHRVVMVLAGAAAVWSAAPLAASAVPAALAVRETNGTWKKAIEVPGSGTLDAGGSAEVESVSCASAGNCAAIGVYSGGSGTQAFVASEAHGAWGTAIEVPGFGALNKHSAPADDAVSCASAGNCTAVGGYQ